MTIIQSIDPYRTLGLLIFLIERNVLVYRSDTQLIQINFTAIFRTLSKQQLLQAYVFLNSTCISNSLQSASSYFFMLFIRSLHFSFSFDNTSNTNLRIFFKPNPPHKAMTTSRNLPFQQLQLNIQKYKWLPGLKYDISSFKLYFRDSDNVPDNVEQIKKKVIDNVIKIISGQWRFLGKLKINNASITDQTVRQLVAIQLKFLVVLDLENNQISSQGVKVLALCQNFCYLRELSLKKNKIGNEGVKYVSAALWPNLMILNLSHIHSTTHGLQYLRKHTLPKLTLVNYSYNIVKLACLRTLIELDIPDIKLEYSFITVDNQGVLCSQLEQLVYVNRLAKEEDIVGWVDDNHFKEQLRRIYAMKLEL